MRQLVMQWVLQLEGKVIACCHFHLTMTIAHGHGCANLPVRVRHLMPFHIQHTGPAPVSIYFRIRPHAGTLCPLSSIPEPSLSYGDSQTEPTTAGTATVNTKVVLVEEKENTSAAVALLSKR